jgi:hypothetical protein
MAIDERWWKALKGEAYKKTFQAVERAEQELGAIFQRHFLLECLYDPNNPDAEDTSAQERVTENAIATNVDTVTAVIATVDIGARFETDGADWKQQRIARRLEWYSEEMQERYAVLTKCRRAFKESVKKGNGLTKYYEWLGAPRVDHVMIENIVVPLEETRDGRAPRQLHQWDYIDADELTAAFPEYADEIEKARVGSRRRRGTFTPGNLIRNDVECLWSYRLPIGTKGKKGYVEGREVLAIYGVDLIDRPYEDDGLPYGMMVWSERNSSFYGISGAERIMGLQRALNKRNWQIERALDQVAMPTVYVRPADANLAVKSNRIGTIAVIRGDMPQYFAPPAVPAETYQSRVDLRNAAQEEFGQTSMVTHGAKPAGIDSGIAMREFKDQTSQRYAQQEKSFEQLVLDTIAGLLGVCKKLGKSAPTMLRRTRFGDEHIEWKDVDLKDARVQMQAASNLNRTPAGRMQMVIEFAQAGIISTDQARRLVRHPDLERELSLYTSALESIEHDLDAIADGKTVMPEPYTNLKMAVWRGQAEYLQWRDDGAPEAILEALRQYIVVAAARMAELEGIANHNAAAAAPAAAPAPMPGDVPPVDAPMTAPPQAALSSQAMQVQAA